MITPNFSTIGRYLCLNDITAMTVTGIMGPVNLKNTKIAPVLYK